MEQRDIKSMLPDELAQALKEMGAPAFRAGQVLRWLHRGVLSFDEMTDLSLPFRAQMQENFYISTLKIKKKLVSGIDSTVKYLYGLKDGQAVETVLMGYRYGDSLCISTQVGCRMGCGFCASNIGGLVRGLAPSEMLDQILVTQRDSGRHVSHVVLMGIGEPLDNFENVMRFLTLLSAPGELNLSLRHVSLSTCGLVDGIYRLMERHLQLTLSVSLHAPNDQIRSSLMPVNRRYPIGVLLKACRDYAQATGRRISFEYAMIQGVNDSDACAEELAGRLRGMLCHVNLIPANEVHGRGYLKSSRDRIARFCKILGSHGISVTVRRTLGADINASCGQLRRDSGAIEGGNLF